MASYQTAGRDISWFGGVLSRQVFQLTLNRINPLRRERGKFEFEFGQWCAYTYGQWVMVVARDMHKEYKNDVTCSLFCYIQGVRE